MDIKRQISRLRVSWGRRISLELALEANFEVVQLRDVKDPNGIVVAPFDDTTKDRVASSKPNPWILVGGGVVTVGGLVTGLVYNVKANNAYDKAQALKDEIGRSGCYVGSANATALL